jgi:hypothetical protein
MPIGCACNVGWVGSVSTEAAEFAVKIGMFQCFLGSFKTVI